MLIFNFCMSGRCDVSLAHNRYAIVREKQICVSTFLPTKDFYYPGRLYEGVQIFVDLEYIRKANGMDFVSQMGIQVEDIRKMFCKSNGTYLQRMSDVLQETANAVGYENQGKFAKVFAEPYGVLPLEY